MQDSNTTKDFAKRLEKLRPLHKKTGMGAY